VNDTPDGLRWALAHHVYGKRAISGEIDPDVISSGDFGDNLQIERKVLRLPRKRKLKVGRMGTKSLAMGLPTPSLATARHKMEEKKKDHDKTARRNMDLRLRLRASTYKSFRALKPPTGPPY
jgi:hypothetical protein